MRRTLTTVVAALAITGGVGAVVAYAQTAPTPSLPTPGLDVPDVEVPAPGDSVLPDGSIEAAPEPGTTHNCTGHINRVLAALVQNRTITQAQADAIKQGVVSRLGSESRPTPETIRQAVAQTLRDLVAKRTITQAQSDAVTAAVAQARRSRGGEAGFVDRAPVPGVFTV